MTVNHWSQSGVPSYFPATHKMIDRLITQSIQVQGFQVYYMPRKWVNVDEIFTEDRLSEFDYAIPLEMYLENVQGFEGQGDFFSKFGVEINDTCTFTVSRSRWDVEVGRSGKSVLPNRPAEGDLIYFPMSSTLFEIKKVISNNPFYQLGKLFTYKLDCEIVTYSQEPIKTGIDEIDNNPYLHSLLEENYVVNLEDGEALSDESGEYFENEDYNLETLDPGSQNNTFTKGVDSIIDFSETNPFAEVQP